MSAPIDHTASYLLDVEHPTSGERWSIYRCDRCFALIASPDAADHGQWHADSEAAIGRVLHEIGDWPAADFWHRDAVMRAIKGGGA